MSDNNTTTHGPEARLADAGHSDLTDPGASLTAEPSGTTTAPPPEPTSLPTSKQGDDEEDDFFIPRGQAVQTAAGGSKKGGRPR
ncbi:hypothetical protein C2E23DRAFT_815395 [Lenzites betulinus]|nr:hypothetical protein C2E23DRAFT_815395 [Lenzites betulinus]